MRGCGEGKQWPIYPFHSRAKKRKGNETSVTCARSIIFRNFSKGARYITGWNTNTFPSKWDNTQFVKGKQLRANDSPPLSISFSREMRVNYLLRIRRLRFGPVEEITRETLKLNSQKRIAKLRGDDVARIITVFRAGTSVISHNWSSFRVANWNLFILIFSSSGTKSHVRNVKYELADADKDAELQKKKRHKGSIYFVGTKIFS